jgi:retron-type reverse transcriptase
LVKAGYVEFDKKKRTFIASDVGVPQGGIVSPLLSNLVLHELDIYMEQLIKERKEFSVGKPPTKNNPAYSLLNNKIRTLKGKKDQDGLRTALRLRRHLRVRIPNPHHSLLKYVRYADD